MNLKEHYKNKLNTKLNENIQEGAVGDLLKSAGKAIWNKAKTIPSLIANQVQKKLSTGDYSAMGILKQIQQHQFRKLSNDPGARRSGYKYSKDDKTGIITRSRLGRGVATLQDKSHKEHTIK
jgi:hypothetical protein